MTTRELAQWIMDNARFGLQEAALMDRLKQFGDQQARFALEQVQFCEAANLQPALPFPKKEVSGR